MTSTTLPALPEGKTWNAEEEKKYREFNTSRQQYMGNTGASTKAGDKVEISGLSASGVADGSLGGGALISRYQKLEGQFARYMDDPYTEKPVERAPVTDEVEIVISGAGFGGLMITTRLREQGFTDIVICEKGGDVGGTWYWNRYPGIACDIESYSYLPLLEETDYIPKDKFSSGFEIMEHCQRIAEKYKVYESGLFHTTITSSTWDEGMKRWIVKTDRGDDMKAKFVILANGILTTPKLARIEGMQSYKGQSFHTSRWDYNIDLRGKTVGIIGTGATSVQAVPELAKVVGQLYVFQRTPSSIDVRLQKPTNYEQIEKLREADPLWAKNRRNRFVNFSDIRASIHADDDYLTGKTDVVPTDRDRSDDAATGQDPMELELAESFKIMEQIRMRVDAQVKDPKTAAALKPYYPYACKRPTFHDEYLPTFNLPHVHLVDTAPKGVELINEKGPVHDGKEYPLDVLIYATGFQWMGTGSFQTITGRGGDTLAAKWEREGTKTLLGLQSKGFPNLFIISGPQGGGGAIFTALAEEQCDYMQFLFEHMRRTKNDVVDITKESEDEWAEHCAEADIRTAPMRNCVTYYNGEGTAKPGSLAYYGAGWGRKVGGIKKTLGAGNNEDLLFEGSGYKWEMDTRQPASRL